MPPHSLPQYDKYKHLADRTLRYANKMCIIGVLAVT